MHQALEAVAQSGSTDPALVAIEARRIADRRSQSPAPAPRLERSQRPPPSLAGYDGLLVGSAR